MSVWRESREGPLAGLRVVDMSTTMMGPYATLLLAQMGADVNKVEAPFGDIARMVADTRGQGLGSPFLNINRGKRSVIVDLSDGRRPRTPPTACRERRRVLPQPSPQRRGAARV